MKLLIIISVLTALLAVAGSIIVGVRNFDGVVTDDPYEKGLQWDKLQREKTTAGWKVDIQEREYVTGDNKLLISILNKDGAPLAASNVSVSISRPSSSAYDRNYRTEKLYDGLYRTVITFPLFGLWHITTDVLSGDLHLSFVNKVYVKKKRFSE